MQVAVKRRLGGGATYGECPHFWRRPEQTYLGQLPLRQLLRRSRAYVVQGLLDSQLHPLAHPLKPARRSSLITRFLSFVFIRSLGQEWSQK